MDLGTVKKNMENDVYTEFKDRKRNFEKYERAWQQMLILGSVQM